MVEGPKIYNTTAWIIKWKLGSRRATCEDAVDQKLRDWVPGYCSNVAEVPNIERELRRILDVFLVISEFLFQEYRHLCIHNTKVAHSYFLKTVIQDFWLSWTGAELGTDLTLYQPCLPHIGTRHSKDRERQMYGERKGAVRLKVEPKYPRHIGVATVQDFFFLRTV